MHSRENPSKGLTAALAAQVPPEAKLIPGLCSPATGRLVAHGRPLAQLMATYQANISKASPRKPESVQEVVDAVASSTFKLSAEEAEGIGSMQVDEAEVKAALKHSKPGTAPGLDGLPVELYRRCGDIFIPVLAKVFTAIGMTETLPAGLLDGVISSIYKKGQRSDPANYRPITVLNTDYRLLAKVLANRLKGVIGKLVHPAQTGFVPGRHIGENLLLNQLLPSALVTSRAAAVCCDFRKAYDTVDRGFLFRIMEAQGVGPGFMKWVKLILSNTSACACINGHLSGMVAFTAGVRQGCPLAPYLYLLVTQALHCLLSTKGFGVQVEGKRLVASMYADDTQSYLTDVFSDLPAFKSTMLVFEEASNQALSIPKSFVLVIGKEARRKLWTDHYLTQVWQQRGPAAQEALVQDEAVQLATAAMVQDKASIPEGITLHGFSLVSEVTSLGLLLRADGTVQADWPALMAKVKKAYTFISRLKLSRFGRAIASSSYGISKLLYAAEFAGMPPAHVVKELNKLTAKLVDRGQAPEDRPGRQVFTGVKSRLLAGHPSTGGFGSMPWEQHIAARHAVWGVRMMMGSSDTPWIYVARRLLCPLGSTCAAWQRLGIAMCTQPGKGPTGKYINPCLDRLAAGLRALPQWRHGNSIGITPGTWGVHMPLWCNPFICTTGRTGPLPTHGLEVEFSDFANIASFTSLKDALLALEALRGGTLSAAAYAQWRLWWVGNSPAFITQDRAFDRLTALVEAIPACWKQAVNVHGYWGEPSAEQIVVDKLLPKIVWWYPRSTLPVGLEQLKVKQATKLQLGPLLEDRAAKQVSFLSEAVAALPQGHNISPDCMPRLYKQVWQLPWDNKKKQVFWLLTLNGLPTAERLHKEEEACSCGAQMPGRAHHFWECPVAAAVRGEIERALNHTGGQIGVQRDNVWLLSPPHSPGLHRGVWLVVCLAAMLAMHKGMRLLTRWRLHRPGDNERAPPPAPRRIAAASRVATASFWDEIQDFLSLGLSPATWVSELTQQHPFIKLTTLPCGERKLALNRV